MNHELLEETRHGRKPTTSERRELVAELWGEMSPEQLGEFCQVSVRTIWEDKRINKERAASADPNPLTKMRADHEANIRAMDESLAAADKGTETYMRHLAEKADMQRKFNKDYSEAVANARGSERKYEFVCILPDAVDAKPRCVEIAELTDEERQNYQPFIVDAGSVRLARAFIVNFDALTREQRESIANLPTARLVL